MATLIRAILPAAVLALGLAGGWAGDADARERSRSVVTPKGSFTKNVARDCAGGGCNRAATATGPRGRSVANTGTVTRTGPGQFNSAGTVTGPRGGTAGYTGTTQCASGACTTTLNRE